MVPRVCLVLTAGCLLLVCYYVMKHHGGSSASYVDHLPDDTTAFKCFGVHPSRRACLFSNLYFNIEDGAFYMSGLAPSTADLVLREVDLSPRWQLSTLEKAPQPEHVTARSGLHVFWDIIYGAGYSFGHALVHNLFPMYTVLHYLLGDNVPIRLHVVVANNEDSKIFRHISAASEGRVETLDELIKYARAENSDWIWFRWVVLGEGNLAKYANALNYPEDDHTPPIFFNNPLWWSFRAWMFDSVGFNPNYQPEKPRIIINDKATGRGNITGKPDSRELGDRRRILNIDNLHAHLKASFPEAQVERVRFTTLTWHEQLEQLMSATVFISTEGSSSFRYVFLPEGACAIVIAHPDNTTSGAESLATSPQFHEIEKYFRITYIRFMQYAVDVRNKREYVKMYDQRFSGPDPYREVNALYDSNIIVNLTRMERMVRAALTSVKLTEDIVSQRLNEQQV